jgi:hypothetical protein
MKPDDGRNERCVALWRSNPLQLGGVRRRATVRCEFGHSLSPSLHMVPRIHGNLR